MGFIVIITPQVQSLGTIGLVIIIMVLFMAAFLVVTLLVVLVTTTFFVAVFTTTASATVTASLTVAIRTIASVAARGGLLAFRLTAPTITAPRGIRVASGVRVLRRLVGGLVPRTVAGGAIRVVVIAPFGTITSSGTTVSWRC